jgi:hypothetical protein
LELASVYVTLLFEKVQPCFALVFINCDEIINKLIKYLFQKKMATANGLLSLDDIKELEASRVKMQLLLEEIDNKKWVRIHEHIIKDYAQFIRSLRERLNFLDETKPKKIEFNMHYIQFYKLKETFATPIQAGFNGLFDSFTNNFYFDIVFNRNEETSVNQFYRRIIERKQLEHQFNNIVIEIFGALVYKPMEQLDIKITTAYEELASSMDV